MKERFFNPNDALLRFHYLYDKGIKASRYQEQELNIYGEPCTIYIVESEECDT